MVRYKPELYDWDERGVPWSWQIWDRASKTYYLEPGETYPKSYAPYWMVRSICKALNAIKA